jgi:hypothetical protein
VTWDVEYTDEFEDWWGNLNEGEQTEIDAHVGLLEEKGPGLRFPYSSDVNNSQYGEMRELRIQYKGDPYRILYAFDPRRTAILLIGGNKTGNDRWYIKFVPIADKLYAEHLKEINCKER